MGRSTILCTSSCAGFNIQAEVENFLCTHLRVAKKARSEAILGSELGDYPQASNKVIHQEIGVTAISPTRLSTGLLVRISRLRDDWNSPVKRAKRPGALTPKPLLVPVHILPTQSGTMSKTNNGLMEAARKHLVLLRTDTAHLETYVRLAHEYGHSPEDIAETAWLTVDLVNDILRGDA